MSCSSMAAGDPPIRPVGSYWTEHSGWITTPADSNSINLNSIWNDITTDPDSVVSAEELRIRRENTLVRELYEQYKVALILASDNE